MFSYFSEFAFGQDSGSVACGGILTASDTVQTLTSPNYPANYDNNLNCTWTIISPIAGKQVEIEIENFQTESCCDAIDVRIMLFNIKSISFFFFIFF